MAAQGHGDRRHEQTGDRVVRLSGRFHGVCIEIENALCEPDANEQAEPEQVPVSAENGRESMASASHSTINDETEEQQ